MKIKHHIPLLLLIILAFFFLYLFLAARPLVSEFQLIPDWTVKITDTQNKDISPQDRQIPFILGQYAGYISENGSVSQLNNFPFRASFSDKYYTVYEPDAADTPFYNNQGQKQGVIEGAGFPFFTGDRIYVFLPGGSSFAACDEQGLKQWQYDAGSPLLAFSSSNGGVAAGLADGTVITFDHTGKQLTSFEPGGSNYGIIYGVDISPTGTYTACISGLDRQRFVLTQYTGSISKVIFHEYLETQQREPVLVRFSADERTVFYNYNGGLGIADCKSGNTVHIPLEGKILEIAELPETGLSFILCKTNSRFYVYIIEGSSNLIGSFSFTAENAFIAADSSGVYVGKDDLISHLSVKRS